MELVKSSNALKKPVRILVLAVVTTALVAGGLTYYAVDRSAEADNAALRESIANLHKQVLDIENTATPAVTPTVLPTMTPATAVDPTADWKTYASKSLGFSLRYPADANPTLELNDQYNRMTAFGEYRSTKYFEVRLFRDTNTEIGVNYGWLDSELASTDIALGGITGYQARSITGYGDGDEKGVPFVDIGARRNGDVYHLVFYGDATLSREERQILATFAFTK